MFLEDNFVNNDIKSVRHCSYCGKQIEDSESNDDISICKDCKNLI